MSRRFALPPAHCIEPRPCNRFLNGPSRPLPLPPWLCTLFKTGLLASVLWLGGCDSANDSHGQAQIHLASGEAYLQQGQYRAAMIEARNVIRLAPDESAGYLLLARLYNQLGNARQAADILQRSPEPDTLAASLERAEAELQQGKFRSARATLAQIETAAQTEAPFHWQRLSARALAGSGEREEARRLYLQMLAVSVDPQTQLELARLELAEGQLAVATEELMRIGPDHAQFAEAQQLLASIAYQQGELEQAERLLTHALAAIPSSDMLTPLKVRVLRQLSETLTKLGRPSDALVYNRLLAEAAPGMQEQQQKFSEALELYRTGNLEAAEALLTQLYEVNPNHNQSGLLLGLVHYQRGDYAAAGQLLDQHVDPETHSPQLIEATAVARLQQHHAREALDLLQQALEDHPQHAGLLAIYGMTALRDPTLRDQGALALQKALALEPRRNTLRLPLASYYLQTGKPEQALAQLQAAATHAPEDPRLQSAYITYLVAQGHTEQAQRAAQRFLEASGKSVEALVLKGEVEAYQGNYAAAGQAFEAALEADPEWLSANEGRAQLALRQQQWELAADYFHRAIQLAPTSERAYKGLLTAYEARGDRHGGVLALQDLSRYPEHAAIAHAVLAEYAMRHGRTNEASIAITAALDQDIALPYIARTAATVFRAEARAAQDEGDTPRARARLMAAIEQVPTDIGALSDLVVVELAAGQRNEAERIIARIEQQPGGATPAALMTAYAHQQRGDRDLAMDTLQEAWHRHPDPEIASRLYRLFAAAGQHDSARLLALDWSRHQPNDARPLAYLAAAAQAKKNYREAQDYYERALSLSPNNAALLNNLAWLYFERGNPKAESLARKAAQLAPDHAGILDTYGWILVQNGNRTEGLSLLERAAAIDPDSADIAAHLREAQRQR